MFIGHYAVALAAKKAAPKTSLGTMFISAQLIDLLWPIFLLLGIEQVRIAPGNTVVTPLDFFDYPFTHSLAGVIVWAIALGLIYLARIRYRRGAWIVGCGVVSHWLLDMLSHRPDLPLVPGGETFVGLGLWNSMAGTLVVEIGLFTAGLAVYSRVTKALDRTGRYGLWALAALLLLLYMGNLFGPPPPNESMLAFSGLALWLFVPWAYWIDRHRKTGQ